MDSLRSFFMTAPVDPSIYAPSLWFIIALPLLGAFVCGVFGKMLGRGNVHLIACSTVAGSFVLSLVALDRKSTRLNSSHSGESRMPSSA